MATTLKSWEYKEELTSSKLNQIQDTIMQNIINNENDISGMIDQRQLHSNALNGEGVYEKASGSLEVTVGSGLEVDVAAGEVLVNGVWITFSAVTNVGLTDSSTNKVYVDDAGTIAATTGTIPDNSILLATVTTDDTSVTDITDKRVDLATLIEVRIARDTFSSLADRLDKIQNDATVVSNHASSHQNEGDDEISVQGLSGELADPQPAKTQELTGNETAAGVEAGASTTVTVTHTALTVPAYPEITVTTTNATGRVLSNNSDEYGNDKFTVEVTNNDSAAQDISFDWNRAGV